jgi:hypothetical protein
MQAVPVRAASQTSAALLDSSFRQFSSSVASGGSERSAGRKEPLPAPAIVINLRRSEGLMPTTRLTAASILSGLLAMFNTIKIAPMMRAGRWIDVPGTHASEGEP